MAARLRSFERAALELSVTPTAVSHQIQNLEDALGTRLFHRHPSGLELTSAGRLALPCLQDGFARLREAVNLVDAAGSGDVLTVLAPPSFAMRWLMPKLHRFALEHPDVDVRVSTRMRNFGYRVLRGAGVVDSDALQNWCDEFDIVIGFGRSSHPGFATTPLFDITLTALCSPKLFPAEDKTIDLGDLCRKTFLHDDRGDMYEQDSYWDIWLGAQGIARKSRAAPGIHFSHALLAIGAAIEGLGATVSTPALARDDLAAGRLISPIDVEIPLGSGYYLVSSEAAARRQTVDSFVRWAAAQAANEREIHARLREQWQAA